MGLKVKKAVKKVAKSGKKVVKKAAKKIVKKGIPLIATAVATYFGGPQAGAAVGSIFSKGGEGGGIAGAFGSLVGGSGGQSGSLLSTAGEVLGSVGSDNGGLSGIAGSIMSNGDGQNLLGSVGTIASNAGSIFNAVQQTNSSETPVMPEGTDINSLLLQKFQNLGFNGLS